MQPLRPERYPNWREAYGALAQSPQRGEYDAPDELLEAHLRRLQSQVLQTLQARDRFYFALKTITEQAGRSPDHQVLVEEWGATALKAFSQGSSYHLREAIERMLKAWRQERDRPVGVHSPQQPSQPRQQPQSVVKRLLGG
jgi:hypothetical protein